MSELTTTIDLMRHGEPVGGRKYRGQLDDPLSEKGWQQMRAAVGEHSPWQHIVSSPLQRCQAFALEMARSQNLPLSFDARFMEVKFGVWEGKTAEQLRAQDPQVIERFKRGDRRAFEMLVVKYQRRIERLIARMVRDTDLVEDIAQETFIRAYRALPQFRGESAFYTWLYRIAVNSAKKALADFKRDPLVSESALRSSDEGEETSRAENELTDGETPEALLASKEIAGVVNAAIEALSEDLRQAITLREIEGLSYEEIAEVMNCPIGTVRSRIFRAREAIATRLRPLLDTREGTRW